jgi:hypothetical protein
VLRLPREIHSLKELKDDRHIHESSSYRDRLGVGIADSRKSNVSSKGATTSLRGLHPSLRCDDRKSGGVTARRNFNARATSHDRNRTMDNRHKVYNRRDARQPLTALTALCLGQTMFGFRNDAKQYASCVRSRLVELGEPFLHLRLTTQKRYDCSAAFPCREVLCTNSTSARLYFLNVL